MTIKDSPSQKKEDAEQISAYQGRKKECEPCARIVPSVLNIETT